MIDDTHEHAYVKLSQYCEYIIKFNPDSIAFIESINNNQFRRAFVRFNVNAEGFILFIGWYMTHAVF